MKYRNNLKTNFCVEYCAIEPNTKGQRWVLNIDLKGFIVSIIHASRVFTEYQLQNPDRFVCFNVNLGIFEMHVGKIEWKNSCFLNGFLVLSQQALFVLLL